jgi:Protein of unknown function (DUF2384)
MSLAPDGLSHPQPSPNVARIGAQNIYRGLGAGLTPNVEFASPQTQSPVLSRGYVDAFVKTCQRWHLSLDQQIVLLGYKGSELLGRELLTGRILAFSQDAKDRTGYVLGISIGLGALFDESEAAELAWLSAPRPALAGQSALGCILEGRMSDLTKVAELVARERGL